MNEFYLLLLNDLGKRFSKRLYSLYSDVLLDRDLVLLNKGTLHPESSSSLKRIHLSHLRTDF